jgi:ElaB/YqjD/DUF883 family membrane-anchored ribosome-binding protein
MDIALGDIERRMHALERRLERTGGNALRQAKSSLSDVSDRWGDTLATVLGEAADRLRGGARSVGDEASRFSQEAAKYGNEALRRLSHEVEHRPLVLLAVAAGVGFLVGVAGRRHN